MDQANQLVEFLLDLRPPKVPCPVHDRLALHEDASAENHTKYVIPQLA